MVLWSSTSNKSLEAFVKLGLSSGAFTSAYNNSPEESGRIKLGGVDTLRAKTAQKLGKQLCVTGKLIYTM